MNETIKNILRENTQMADKYYFSNGKLSERVREVLFKMTQGDPYTKLVTDIYYYLLTEGNRTASWALSQLDPKHVPSDKIENDADYNTFKQVKDIYQELKNYNKNVFPIKGFNINGVENVGYFISALKQRKLILNLMRSWPSKALRNMKQDIRTERTYPELQSYRSDLEYFDAHYSLLNNRNPEAKKAIENKIFASTNNTLEDLLRFVQEKEGLLGGTDLNKKAIIDIVKQDQEYDEELRIRYNKNDIMIIEVSGPEGIKKIGCNSVWCFTYSRNGYTNWNDWNQNSTNGIAYIIVDLTEDSDSEGFMHVLTKPLMNDYEDYGETGYGRLYNMANRDVHDDDEPEYGVNAYIERFLDLPTAMKIMNFGIQQPKEKKPKQKYKDPNQLSLDLHESKTQIKNILRETFGQ